MTKRYFILCVIITLFSQCAIAAAIISKPVIGNWNNPGSWVGGKVPSNDDDVVIVVGSVITIQGLTTMNDLTIDSGATLSDNGSGSILVKGNLIVNGIWAGGANITLSGSSKIIDGSGVISNTGALILNGNKTIQSTARLTKGVGAITIAVNTSVTNRGWVTFGGLINGSNSSTSVWINSANSTLNVGGALLGTGTLDATAAGNTVNYLGSTAQTIKRTNLVSFTYHHLSISGAGSAVKSLVSNTYIINGDLTINSSLAGSIATPSTIILKGNWLNTGGTFTAYTSTVTMSGGAKQLVNSVTGETFFNLTINNPSGVVFDNDTNITNSLTMTYGNIDMYEHTLTLGKDISNVGLLNRNAGAIVGNFERWVSSSPAFPILFPVGTASTYRPISITSMDVTNAGSIIAAFVDSSPGKISSPPLLDADNNKTYNTFSDGYWALANSNSFACTYYSLNSTLNNYTPFSGTGFNGIDNSTRLLTRTSPASSWALEGTHVSFSAANTVGREGLTILPKQFCLGDDTNCEAPTELSISASGGSDICKQSTNQDYAVLYKPGSVYTWNLSSTADSISSGQGTNRISVKWKSEGGKRIIKVVENNGCSNGPPASKTINVHPIAPDLISGKANAPTNSNGELSFELYSVSPVAGYSYTWQINPGIEGAILSGQNSNSITVKWGATGKATLEVTSAYSDCVGTSNPTSINVDIYSVIYSNKASGNWDNRNTWTCDCIPTATDNVVILNGHTITVNNPSATEVKHLSINSGGILNTSSNPMTVYGDLNLNGSLIGSGTLTLSSSGNNPTLDGIGTIVTTPVTIASSRTINSTALLSKNSSSGAFSIGTGAVVTNYGSITLAGGLTGNSSTSTWINATNSSLNVGGALLSTGVLNASAVGNTVKYFGSGSSNIKLPVFGQYYNLTIAHTSGTRTAPSNTIRISNDFVNDCTGVFLPNAGTFDFNGASTISGTSVTTFNNLLISGSLTLNSNVLNVNGSLSNSGYFNSNNSTVNLTGSLPQTISGNNFNFFNLTSSNSSVLGSSINSIQTIINNLTLSSGKLSANANMLLSGPSSSITVSSGTLNINANVSLADSSSSITLASGSLIIDGNKLLMPKGSTIFLADGIIANSSPGGGPWNVVYNGATNRMTTLEIPSEGSILKLIVSNTGDTQISLNQRLNVRGDILLNSSSGGFNSGVYPVGCSSLNIAGGNFIAPGSSLNLTSGDLIINDRFAHNLGNVVFSGKTKQSIRGGRSGSTKFNSITITDSSTLIAPSQLIVLGELRNDGEFSPGNGKVVFCDPLSDRTTVISGNKKITFYDIDVENGSAPSGIDLILENWGGVDLINILNVSAATLDADGSSNDKVFRLVSSGERPTKDASIDKIEGGEVIGNVTVQRYMERIGNPLYDYQVWRNISSPVISNVDSLQKFLPVTGNFSGASSVPNQSLDPSTGKAIASMFRYEENTTTDLNGDHKIDMKDGWFDFPDYGGTNSQKFQTGRGYSVFIFGPDSEKPNPNGSPATYDLWALRGPINSGTISLPVSYTGARSAKEANNGWNLVGNPYPCAVDWDAPGWVKKNVSNAIYLDDYSAANPVFASYVNGIGTNGGSSIIPLGQGFWVKADTISPELIATENVKAAGLQSRFFRVGHQKEMIRITLEASDKSKDETVIYFADSSTTGFDRKYDALKLRNQNRYLNLSSTSTTKEKFAINGLPFLDCAPNNVSLDISDVLTGTYYLHFSEFESMPSSMVITLRDNFKNISIDVRQVQLYSFTVNKNVSASYGSTRFSLAFTYSGIEASVISEGSEVCNPDLSNVIVTNSSNDYKYYLLSSADSSILSLVDRGNGGDLELSVPAGSLRIGSNNFILRSVNRFCSRLISFDTVSVRYVPNPSSPEVISGYTCGKGRVELVASGAPSDGYYSWYDSADSEYPLRVRTSKLLTDSLTKTKSFYVASVNNLGCESVRKEVQAEVIHLEPAQITVEDLNVIKSNYEIGNQWLLDGEFIVGADTQTLTISKSGVYTLIVDQEGCIVSDMKVMVLTETLPSLDQILVYPNPAKGILMIEGSDDTPWEGELLNCLGEKEFSFDFVMYGRKREAKVNLSILASGVYFIRILTNHSTRIRKVIKQ